MIQRLNSEIATLEPCSPQAEAVVIAQLLSHEQAAILVCPILKQPECFFIPQFKMIYESILNLVSKVKGVDLVTVTEELRGLGYLDDIGGPYGLVEISNYSGYDISNIETHAQIVLDKFILRRLKKMADNSRDNCVKPGAVGIDVAQEMSGDIFDIIESGFVKKAKASQELVMDALRRYEAASQKDDGIMGIPSGYKDIDKHTLGWQPKNLIILAARPGMGKSALALEFAEKAANNGFPTAFFSLEASEEEVTDRRIAKASGISTKRLKSGKLHDYEWQQLSGAIERVSDVPIYIDDTTGLNIIELRSKLIELKIRKGVRFVIIDYLQLMTGDKKGNREQEVSSITRTLKKIAGELQITIIALSQLSRAVETRGGNKRPQLSDLRESGSIEQDANIVMFLYRPEYYKILEDEEGQSLKGVCEVIFAKDRDGGLGTFKLKFIEHLTKFEDMPDEFAADLIAAPSAQFPVENTNEIKPDNSRINFDDIPF